MKLKSKRSYRITNSTLALVCRGFSIHEQTTDASKIANERFVFLFQCTQTAVFCTRSAQECRMQWSIKGYSSTRLQTTKEVQITFALAHWVSTILRKYVKLELWFCVTSSSLFADRAASLVAVNCTSQQFSRSSNKFCQIKEQQDLWSSSKWNVKIVKLCTKF